MLDTLTCASRVGPGWTLYDLRKRRHGKAVTVGCDVDELMQVGARRLNLMRVFNAVRALTAIRTSCKEILQALKGTGPTAGVALTHEEMEAALDDITDSQVDGLRHPTPPTLENWASSGRLTSGNSFHRRLLLSGSRREQDGSRTRRHDPAGASDMADLYRELPHMSPVWGRIFDFVQTAPKGRTSSRQTAAAAGLHLRIVSPTRTLSSKVVELFVSRLALSFMPRRTS